MIRGQVCTWNILTPSLPLFAKGVRRQSGETDITYPRTHIWSKCLSCLAHVCLSCMTHTEDAGSVLRFITTIVYARDRPTGYTYGVSIQLTACRMIGKCNFQTSFTLEPLHKPLIFECFKKVLAENKIPLSPTIYILEMCTGVRLSFFLRCGSFCYAFARLRNVSPPKNYCHTPAHRHFQL